MDILTSLAIYVTAWLALVSIVYLIKRNAVRGFVLITWRSEGLAKAVRFISDKFGFVSMRTYLIAVIVLFVLVYLPLPVPIGANVFWLPSHATTLVKSIGDAVGKAASGASAQEVAAAGGQVVAVPIMPGVTIPWDLFPYIAIAVAVGVALHEFAHGYAAVRYKIKLKSAGVFSAFFIVSGAFVELDMQELKKAPLSAKVAVLTSGVAANMALALIALTVFVAILRLIPNPMLIENPLIKLIIWFFIVNTGFATINALPIYPLDGGLLFASLLGRLIGERRALMATYVVSLVLFLQIVASTVLALKSGIYWQMLQTLK